MFTKILLLLFRLVGECALLYLLVGLVAGEVAVNRDFEKDPQGYPLMLYTTGVHLDICLPARTEVWDWTAVVEPEWLGASDPQYLAFGWGEKAFYMTTPTWDKMRADVTLRALFWPSPSALHLTYYAQKPTHRLLFLETQVSPSQLKAICRYLLRSMSLDTKGKCIRIPLEDRLSVSDAFVASPLSYHLFLTCNDWLNRGLKEARLPAVLWTPFDRPILARYSETQR